MKSIKGHSSRSEENIDLKSVIDFIRDNWIFFICSLLVAFSISFVHNQFSIPQYQITSSVLVKDNRNPQADLSTFLYGSQFFIENKDFNNEIQILQSTSLIQEVIRTRGYQVSYYLKEDLFPKNPFSSLKEIYHNSPFEVVYDVSSPQPVNVRFKVVIQDELFYSIEARKTDVFLYDFQYERFVASIPELMIDTVLQFGDRVKGENYSFIINLKDNYYPLMHLDKDFYFTFYSVSELAAFFKKSLFVEPQELNSTIALIKFRSPTIEKGLDFVNGLSFEYLQRSLDKKNHIAMATIDYIDAQLDAITDSLAFTEEELQNFRRNYQVMDLNEKSNRLFLQLQNLETERAELLNKSRLYQQLKSYFDENMDSDELLAPSAMGIEDPNLNTLIKELTSHNSELKALISSNQERSPRVQTLRSLISNLKSTISENISYIVRTSKLQLDDINLRIRRLQNEVDKLPQTQRQLLGIERKFNLNDAVYTFLLEKKAEAQIARASNLPDFEMIEEAALDKKVHPKKMRNYLIALIIGSLFPVVFIKVHELLGVKISSREELEAFIDIPVIGKIIHHEADSHVIFNDFPDSRIAEKFRLLRMNLEFIAHGKEKLTIQVTSSMGEEGKSFISLNMGSTFAKNGKKTLILGFDLRKPSQLYQEFGIFQQAGLSNYLIGQSKLKEIMILTTIKNLYIVPAGIEPPNPFELISSARTAELFEEIRNEFDFVIIDSPPAGYVPDAYPLMQYADIKLLVVRHDFTLKKGLSETMRELKLKDIQGLYLIYNDEPVSRNDLRYNYYSKSKNA
jgi:tyrosine-protein kinase Etk/Wzc